MQEPEDAQGVQGPEEGQEWREAEEARKPQDLGEVLEPEEARTQDRHQRGERTEFRRPSTSEGRRPQPPRKRSVRDRGKGAQRQEPKIHPGNSGDRVRQEVQEAKPGSPGSQAAEEQEPGEGQEEQEAEEAQELQDPQARGGGRQSGRGGPRERAAVSKQPSLAQRRKRKASARARAKLHKTYNQLGEEL